MNYKDIIYCVGCICFCIVIGAAVYEHLGVVPKWSAAPPKSLTMFQGEYGLNAGAFWKLIHPVTLILLIINLIIFWHTERRMFLSIPLIGYVIILITTFVFFVPELINITSTTYSNIADSALIKRAKLWETLSIIRLFVLTVLAIVLLLGLTKLNPMIDA